MLISDAYSLSHPGYEAKLSNWKAYTWHHCAIDISPKICRIMQVRLFKCRPHRQLRVSDKSEGIFFQNGIRHCTEQQTIRRTGFRESSTSKITWKMGKQYVVSSVTKVGSEKEVIQVEKSWSMKHEIVANLTEAVTFDPTKRYVNFLKLILNFALGVVSTVKVNCHPPR